MSEIYLCFCYWSKGAIGQKGIFMGRAMFALARVAWQKDLKLV